VSPWSPDSSAFCYVDAAGDTRVQRLDDPPETLMGIPVAPSAELVEAGIGGSLVAWWSPC